MENSQETAELRVAEGEEGFYMEFWGNPPDEYSISVQSPIGEILYVSSSLGAGTQQLFFIFTETRVLVNYVGMERTTGKQLVYLAFSILPRESGRSMLPDRRGREAGFICGFLYRG